MHSGVISIMVPLWVTDFSLLIFSSDFTCKRALQILVAYQPPLHPSYYDWRFKKEGHLVIIIRYPNKHIVLAGKYTAGYKLHRKLEGAESPQPLYLLHLLAQKYNTNRVKENTIFL